LVRDLDEIIKREIDQIIADLEEAKKHSKIGKRMEWLSKTMAYFCGI